jgi:hypothetical protein
MNKAMAMCEMYKSETLKANPGFLESPKQLEGFDLVFACPDNHVARSRVLDAADQFELTAIICGNEFDSAAAAIYMPDWKDSPLDYRIRYPEILTDKSGSPTETSCTGEALESAPQLALANNTSAVFAMQLMHFWFNIMSEEISSDEESFKCSPVEFNWAPSKCYAITIKMAEEEAELKAKLKIEKEKNDNSNTNSEEKESSGEGSEVGQTPKAKKA